MKKILIIQTDPIYFLEETLRLLEAYQAEFHNVSTVLHVDQVALQSLSSSTTPMFKNIETNPESILQMDFDISFNLSLNESSWDFHQDVQSLQKIGISKERGDIIASDFWSTFLLTLKANPPYLTFHLQDVYRNILGLKNRSENQASHIKPVKRIVFGKFNPEFFSINDLKLIAENIHEHYPHIETLFNPNLDLVDDLSDAIYFGPPTLQSLRISDCGARSILLVRNFEGFNLIPYQTENYILSTKGNRPDFQSIVLTLSDFLSNGKFTRFQDFSYYEVTQENIYGAYLKSLNNSDFYYPFFQCHVVLWNFLLNLFDINLNISQCTKDQILLFQHSSETIQKICRLYDYAIASSEQIYEEAQKDLPSKSIIDTAINRLIEIEEVISRIAESNVILRPVIDYYKIRRSQNNGENLLKHSQSTVLNYAEEQHAMNALHELFSVTLSRNEASI